MLKYFTNTEEKNCNRQLYTTAHTHQISRMVSVGETLLSAIHLITLTNIIGSDAVEMILQGALYTYFVTPWCRVLLEKLTGLQLVKNFLAFHGTRRFITALTPPPVSILGQPDPVHIPTSHLLDSHPNIIHPSTPRSPQWYRNALDFYSNESIPPLRLLP